MESVWFWMGVTLAALAAVYYLPMLLYARFKLTYPIYPRVERFPVDHPKLTDDWQEYLREVIAHFERLDFKLIESMAHEHVMPDWTMVVVLFANRPQREIATATITLLRGPLARSLMPHLEFTTRYRDDSEVRTSNPTRSGAFTDAPNQRTISFNIHRPAELLALHRMICEDLQRDAARAMPLDERFQGDVLRFLTEWLSRDCEAELSTGRMARDEHKGVYRYTWKGAFGLIFRFMFPFRWLTRMKQRRAARQYENRSERGDY